VLTSIATNGRCVVVCDAEDTLIFWTPDDGALERIPGGGRHARFTADGQWLVTITSGDTMRVFRDRALVRDIATGHERLVALAVHPSLARVATTGADGHVRVWDLGSGTALLDLAERARGTAVALSESHVAGGFANGEFVVWDLATKRDLAGGALYQYGTVSALAFSPAGKVLACASSSGGMTVIGAGEKWTAIAGWRTPPKEIATNSIVFTPDGRRFVATHSDDTATLLFPSPNDRLGETFGSAFYNVGQRGKWTRDYIVSDACFFPGTDLMLTTHFTGKVRVWTVGDRFKVSEVSFGVTSATFDRKEWFELTGRRPPKKTCAACGKDVVARVLNAQGRLEECPDCEHVAVDLAKGPVDPDARELLSLPGHGAMARRCLYVALHTQDDEWVLRAAHFDQEDYLHESAAALRRRAGVPEPKPPAAESWAVEHLENAARAKKAALEEAELEAAATGRELFDLVRFETLLNRGAQISRLDEQRRSYYASSARTLAEYVAELHRNEGDLGYDLAAPTLSLVNARTLEEVQFHCAVASPCGACGSRAVRDESIGGSDKHWTWHAICAKCGAKRRFYSILFKRDPRTVRAGRYDLGPGSSKLLEAGTLFAVLDETLAEVAETRPATRDSLLAKRELVVRAIVCLTELLKLAPVGDAQPTTPRLARKSLEKEYIAARRLLETYATPNTITNAMLDAHDAWLSRGAKGPGCIELDGQSLVSERYAAKTLSFAILTRCDLTDTDFFEGFLDWTSLTDVVAERSAFGGVSFSNSKIVRCRFSRSDLSRTKLIEAHVVESDLARTDLDSAQFHDARIQKCRFDGARFGSAILDRATFEECSFVNASFAKFVHPPGTAGAKFVDCDLRDTDWTDRDMRGATFVRCKFDGATGTPASTDGIVLDGCTGWS
jgi:uncharacterized protein YjbI with pentapeptide repeats